MEHDPYLHWTNDRLSDARHKSSFLLRGKYWPLIQQTVDFMISATKMIESATLNNVGHVVYDYEVCSAAIL